MRSPKLVGGSANGQYYRYYAGFTPGFVEDMLRRLDVPTTGLVIDPWNGAGTTTSAAAAAGLAAVGFDINPAAVLLGRARLLSSEVSDSLVPLAVEICEHARAHPYGVTQDDLLGTWFGPATTMELRTLERAVHRVLVDENLERPSPKFDSSLPHTALAAVFYVALFRTVRDLASRYVSSNPTWIKRPTGRRLGVSRSELQASFVRAVRLTSPHLSKPQQTARTAGPSVTVSLASSTDLPLADASVNAVVSSPPYCTRLDYVKATLPELAVMGMTDLDIRRLRDRMIGTPTMSGAADDVAREQWGPKVRVFIDKVAAHPSRASATYYKKYYLQYFRGMRTSLTELQRVVKPGRSAVLVVQDSFYKELHVDLPALIGDMSETLGWARWERHDFKVPRTMASIHPGTRRYRQDFHAVESAIILQK